MHKPSYNLKKKPTQNRAKATVGFIKQAAIQILKENGLMEFTTNHVADRAGVSIGSLYQYFPSKEVLIAELRRDHIVELRELIKSAYQSNLGKPLDYIVEAIIVATIEAHKMDPDLHRILTSHLNDFNVTEDNNDEESVKVMVESLLNTYRSDLRPELNISLAAKLTYRVVESMSHDAVLNQPELLEGEELVKEIKRMVMTYLTY